MGLDWGVGNSRVEGFLGDNCPPGRASKCTVEGLSGSVDEETTFPPFLPTVPAPCIVIL